MNRILLITLLLTSVSHAQWSTDPANNLIVGYGLLPELTSDSAGGCYITYEQNLSYPRRLMLERLNRYGFKPWGGNRRILGLLPEQAFAKITEDGRGGVIVSYADVFLGGTPHEPIIIDRLRVQRIDSSGNFLWEPTGVRVSLSETNSGDQAIVSDGQGGCIVAWRDTMEMIRVQRIDSVGARAWGDSGLFLTFSLEKVRLSYSNSFGLIALYFTNREFRAQRMNVLGQFLWGNGIRVPTGARVMRTTEECYTYLFGGKSLGIWNGQALFTLNHQKIDTTGTILWDSLGVTLDTLNTNNLISMDFSIHSNYSTLSWQQQFAGQWDLRTQIIRANGTSLFAQGGNPVSRVLSGKGLVGVLPSDSLSTVFVWGDSRNPGGIYAQRVDTLGRQMWDSSDVAISIPAFSYVKVTTDGFGGAIIAGSGGNFSIRAQQINKHGILGQVITSVNNTASNLLPSQPALFQNYPNPFNSATTIPYRVQSSGWVTIRLCNLLGQQMHTVVHRFHQPGAYSVSVAAGDLPSGVYMYTMETRSGTLARKLIILK